MSRTFQIVIAILCLSLLAGYASATKLKSSWKNPTATASSLEFKKVIVLVTIKQSFTRKIAEDKIVQIIDAGGSAKAVPSYTLIPDEQLDDLESAKATIQGMDFDGAIVMHYAGSQSRKKYEEQESFNDWYSYQFWGGPAWGGIYNATTTNDLTVYIETMLFSLKENKLIWSGITETKNPKNPAEVVAEIAEDTSKQLQKDGLLAKKKK